MEFGHPLHFNENPAVADGKPSDNYLARKWGPVQFSSTLNIGGCLLGKRTPFMQVESMSITFEGESCTFVKVGKTRPWMYALATGQKKHLCGGLKRSVILETITKELQKDPSVRGEIPAVAEDEDDPMDQMDSIDDYTCRKTIRKRANVRAPTKIITLELPAYAPSAHPKSTSHAKVRVLSKFHRSQLWIDARDLSWLLLYMADELATQNVSISPAAAGNALKGNCPVPGLCIKTRFHKGKHVEYIGSFISGPCTGTEAASRISSMNPTKWKRAVDHGDRWGWTGVSLDDTPPEEVHRAVHYLLMEHLAAVLAEKAGCSAEELKDPYHTVTHWQSGSTD